MLFQETTIFILFALTISLQRNFQADSQSTLTQRRVSALGTPRPFGSDKPSRAMEFNRTGVLLPEYQILATLQPGNVSQFYYLSPREGPSLTLLVSPCSGPISWTLTYVGPPEGSQHPQAQTRWPVKTLVPDPSPLFNYEGAETQNFTIPKARAGLYRFEIKSIYSAESQNVNIRSPSTVLLYATSNILDVLPGSYDDPKGKRRRHFFRFKQRKSKRSLTISWNKSPADPHLLSYCLVVTSGSQLHPSTLCAAENMLKNHSYSLGGSSYLREEHEAIPEGLYCLRDTKLTLHGMKYNTTYNFTLYVISTRSNVSNRVASESIKFRKIPAQNLRSDIYAIVDLRKSNGFANFRYRPKNNVTTIFHVLSCGSGVIWAKLRGPDFFWEKEIIGRDFVKAPPVPPGKRYTLKISTSPRELTRIYTVKILATQDSSFLYPKVSTKTVPRVYRSLRKCHEVTVAVESAGTAKYCVLVHELEGPSSIPVTLTNPDNCEFNRRRRSVNKYELCEEKRPKGTDLPLTVSKLQPGKSYLVQITAQMKEQLLSYPLVRVKTRRICA